MDHQTETCSKLGMRSVEISRNFKMNRFCFSVLALSLASLAVSSSDVWARCAQSAKMAYGQGVVTQKFIDIGQKTQNDPADLFACAAEKETDPTLKGQYYNALARNLEKRGEIQSAYRAYENAALAGNESAGGKIYKAHEKGLYKPRALAKLTRKIYVPRARGKNGSGAALFLANLLDSGQLKGAEFGTSAFWLQRSVQAGSTSGIKRLAEQASRHGNVAKSASYFRMIDKKPASVRALREARNYFLGKGKLKNTKLGMAWLSYASKLAPVPSAKLAVRFYRSTRGTVYASELTRIAVVGGLDTVKANSGGNKKLLVAYAAAKTDKAKLQVLADLIARSKSGDGTSDYALARILATDGGFASFKAADYYISAFAKGNLKALPEVTSMVAVLDPGDPRVEPILTIFSRVAQAGSIDAQKSLGLLYIVGGPVAVDYAKGIDWLKKASDAGDVDAKYRLGVLLVQNKKDEAEYAAGKTYLQSAAASGSQAAKTFYAELVKTSP
jgi:TPR repeat protein